MRSLKLLPSLAVAAIAVLAAAPALAEEPARIGVDYAYYNPVGLLMKEKGWLEEELGDKVKITWVLSAGSNKALEFLNGGSVDFGSSAGSAALLAKANGNPIKAVYIYSKPEWTALVVRKDSPIATVADLKGKRVAATPGTDPGIFLLRALHGAGLKPGEVKIVALQHADGRTALVRGDVDAWSGLDPFMAQTELEEGSRLFFRAPDMNTYGFLNVREEFAKRYPDAVLHVLSAYERARRYAQSHPDELRDALVHAAKLSDAVAAKELERTDISSSAIGETQRRTIVAAGDVLKEAGVIPEGTDIAAVADALIDPKYGARLAQKQAAQ